MGVRWWWLLVVTYVGYAAFPVCTEGTFSFPGEKLRYKVYDGKDGPPNGDCILQRRLIHCIRPLYGHKSYKEKSGHISTSNGLGPTLLLTTLAESLRARIWRIFRTVCRSPETKKNVLQRLFDPLLLS